MLLLWRCGNILRLQLQHCRNFYFILTSCIHQVDLLIDLYFTSMHFTDGFYRLCFNSAVVLFFKCIDPLSHNVHLGVMDT